MDVNVIIDEPPSAVVQTSREKIPLPPGKHFHIFFSYTNDLRDKLWVKRVIDKLETEYGYTCCDHERDFVPGTKIMDNIKYGVKNSEKVVVVFSEEAIDSHYVLLEAEMAHALGLEERKNLLIPVLLDDCDVPEEYMLRTYIDAREGVEETTWWPKLLKSVESTGETSRSPFHNKDKSVSVGAAFAVNQLCSTETKYSFLRCTMEGNTKCVAELRTFGVTDDLFQATYKDLLQSPRVVCRQKCFCFLTFGLVLGFLSLAVLSVSLSAFISWCVSFRELSHATCIFGTTWILFLITVCPVSSFIGYQMFYIKNPDSVRNNIIEYNRKLSKYGVVLTVVPGCMWKKASLIFYKYRFDLCKEFVIRHLMKEERAGTTEHGDIPNRGHMIASTADSPLLSVEEEPRGSGETLDEVNSDEAADVVDVADDEPLLYNQETDNLDYENKAMDLLLLCAPEYFALAYAKRLKNPKENRHGIDVMCLCQYLEEANKGFRNTVKRIRPLRRKSNIEENNKHL